MKARTPPKPKKVFGDLANDFGFSGKGDTRYMEYPTHYVAINFQRSVYGKSFYVNVAILYKELLQNPVTETEIAEIVKSGFPHVGFRFEQCPGNQRDLQEQLDKCVSEERMDDLAVLLRNATKQVVSFLEQNYDRETIRRLRETKQLNALVLKEV